MEWNKDIYMVSTDKALLSVDRVCALLGKSYWANNRPRAVIEKSIENSICYGVYCGGEQVGFGRIITDYATTFYICDVIIDENHRGRGLGKMLLACMMDSENFKSITGLLVTSDAHGLYRKYGFNPLENVFMLRRGEPNI
jgi:ribosomal protein S18 acetylase RimI-like enzyme